MIVKGKSGSDNTNRNKKKKVVSLSQLYRKPGANTPLTRAQRPTRSLETRREGLPNGSETVRKLQNSEWFQTKS